MFSLGFFLGVFGLWVLSLGFFLFVSWGCFWLCSFGFLGDRKTIGILTIESESMGGIWAYFISVIESESMNGIGFIS